MKKFLALYVAPRAEIEKWMKMPKDEAEKGMAEWKKWLDDNRHVFADFGASLGKTKSLSKDGLKDTRNEFVGYSTIEGETALEAAKKLEGHPHLAIEGCTIELIECLPSTM